MATETLYPDGTVWSISGWTGTTTVDRVDDTPDGTWLLSDQSTSINTVRASLPTPSGNLNTGAGLQTFRAYVRTTGSGSGLPYLTLGVRETGDSGDLQQSSPVTVTTGQTGTWYSFTWDASLLNDGLDGTAVEVLIYTEARGGGPNKNWLDIDSIEWIADYTAVIPVTVTPSGVSATGSVGDATTGISKTLTVSGLGATGTSASVTLFGESNLTVTGLVGTAAIDSVIPAAEANIALTGLEATAVADLVSTSISKIQLVTGLAATAAVESVTVQAIQAPTVVVNSLAATGAVEPVSLSIECAVTVSGISVTGQAGTVTTTAECVAAVSGLVAIGAVASVTVDEGAVSWEQEGFRFRNDDNDEINATWTATQDVSVSLPAETNYRLRMLTLAANNPPGTVATLQYRKVGDTDWQTIQ